MNHRRLFCAAKLGVTLCAALAIAASLAITAQAQTETELYDFTGGSDGGFPHSSLISDSLGNLYGTTEYGGHSNSRCSFPACGTVFKLWHTSSGIWHETLLHSFTGGNDGANPASELAMDSAGNLYGTTTLDGAFPWGTVFKLSPAPGSKWTFSVLYNFTGKTDGGAPQSGVILDSAGAIYGTTSYGGDSGFGVVFKLEPASGAEWKETILHSFKGGDDGSMPLAALISDAAGNFYGTTVSGGTGGRGTAFQLSPLSGGQWKKTTLHSFTGGADGYSPYGGLARDSSGNLFGTTFVGGDASAECTEAGSGCGTVFELSPAGDNWIFTVLHTFSGAADGGGPLAGVIIAPAGQLYGTTNLGGRGTDCTLSCGTVFELSLNGNTWQETVLHTFSDGSDGGNPQAGLTLTPSGNLYGTATTGGWVFEGWGLVFEIKP